MFRARELRSLGSEPMLEWFSQTPGKSAVHLNGFSTPGGKAT